MRPSTTARREAKERVYIFTDSAFMKEAANSLLKVLEEPPDFATIFLLTENAGELLPTIRSRSMVVTLAALSVEEIEQYLAKHRPEWNAKQRALVARLSEGAMGRARSFDLDGYTAARSHALILAEFGIAQQAITLNYSRRRKPIAPAPRDAKRLIGCCGRSIPCLQDLMFLNPALRIWFATSDIQGELKKLAEGADFDWIATASDRLAEVERGMRRNLLRSLSLDAFAAALERIQAPSSVGPKRSPSPSPVLVGLKDCHPCHPVLR